MSDVPESDVFAPIAQDPEPEAWALLISSWEDEQAHLAYLGRFTTMEGYAVAGGRYRAVLLVRPDDAMARRMRDEILKRATVLGLATLPRANPEHLSAWTRRVRVVLALALGAASAWAVHVLMQYLGARS